jgi:hypothetical protein
MKCICFVFVAKTDPFEEVYVNRFIEVLCNHIKDYLLLTDFFFEVYLLFVVETIDRVRSWLG